MFDKSRKKIIISIFGTAVLFLLVTLAAIYVISILSLKNQSREMLGRYVTSYSIQDYSISEPTEEPTEPFSLRDDGHPEFKGPGDGKPHPVDGVLEQMSSFYSVAYGESREILAVDTGWGNLYTETEIEDIAADILDRGKSEGTTGDMLYRVEQRDGYTLVAFMDKLLMEDSMRKVMTGTITVGIIAVFVFLAASLILAKRIVKPLEENDRLQKQFVSDAGHELKTPISVISANAELLSSQIGESKWLSNIQYENERMGSLVKELLALSRAETGEFKAEDVDFSKLVQQEVLPFESVAFEKGLSIISEVSEGVIISGSKNRLAQLVSILTDNAISYSEGGKEIHISLKKEHKQVHLIVCNPAPELPEDVMNHLFDRFFRVDEARSDDGRHFGLGLPIAKAIVDAHHGKIAAEYKEGNVIFKVTLPVGHLITVHSTDSQEI